MSKVLGLLLGLVLGAAVTTAVVLLFSPVSGAQARQRVRDGYRLARAEAQAAVERRRAELEAELRDLQA